VTRKKRKVVMAIVPARKRELGLGCPYVVSAVAEVVRQHPASNKLTRSAPKRVTVGVNGGLGGAASGSGDIRGRVRRNDVWRSAFIQVIR
jgi:hypothetical protein